MDVKKVVKMVDEYGEVMIRTASGTTFELHKHNVEYDKKTGMLKIQGGTEIYWIAAENIDYFWIHKKAID